MVGRSLGCRWRRTGVPIKSCGKYPSNGTALQWKKTLLISLESGQQLLLPLICMNMTNGKKAGVEAERCGVKHSLNV